MKLKSAPIKIQQVVDFLTSRIRSGELRPGDRLGTIRHFAKEFEVSNKTIECAFARMEAEKLVVREAGRGCFVAQPEASFQRKVGLVASLPDMDAHSELPVIFQWYASEKSCLSSAFHVSSVSKLPDQLRLFLETKPDAVMIKGISIFPIELLDEFPETTKIIFIDNYEFADRIGNASYILSDFAMGGRMGVEALLAQDKRKIAILSYAMDFPEQNSARFYAGAVNALAEAGLEPHSFTDTDKTNEDYWKHFLTNNPPDGIIAISDCRTLPVMRMARKLGISIPEDIAVIGYNNTPHAHAWDMTSISNNYEIMVREAFKAIDSDQPVNMKIKPEIIYRSTCPEPKMVHV